MARNLAITKKTYLDGFEGWDRDCYVVWRPVTYADSLELKNLQVDDGDEAKAFEAIFKMTKEHIVGGRVRVIGDDGKPVVVDYETDDLDQMPPVMINRIFAEITGAQFEDPKDSVTAPGSSNAPTTSEDTSETS